EGIWIVEHSFATTIATALRQALLRLDHARAIADNRNEARDALYEYFAGREFGQWLLSLAEATRELRTDLDAEKRAFAARWRKREKQLDRLEAASCGMYGDLQGIMGAALPAVDLLELEPATPVIAALPSAA
ncbi:MAG TPA: DUF2130 domain-containing protein, partial [Gaiellaceae bacterium]|nr:DUF2130 domain-containing protein [Gaiellaceae bacterium]